MHSLLMWSKGMKDVRASYIEYKRMLSGGKDNAW